METEKIKIYYNGQIVEVTPDVYAVLIKTDRKMRYFENDIKVEKYILDESGDKVRIIPSRENSFERLQEECAQQFACESESVENTVLRNLQHEQLRRAIDLLEPDEQELIDALYFQLLSQDAYASQIGLSQQAISKKRLKILKKLKFFLKK